MSTTKIYHVSKNRQMPLLFTEGSAKIEVLEANIQELDNLLMRTDDKRLFLIQADSDTVSQIAKSLKGKPGLQKHPFVFILPEKDYATLRSRLALFPKATLLADSIRPEHLRVIIELILEREHYHSLLKELSSETRRQTHAFEQVLELARKELEEAQRQSDALKALLEYEGNLQKTQKEIEEAMEKANALREKELISLKEQLQVVEKLNEYRDQELKETRAVAEATEKALELSLKENLDREQILVAMDRLRGLSDQELLELYKENQELRKRLGIGENEKIQIPGP